jgi:hypothetical protein
VIKMKIESADWIVNNILSETIFTFSSYEQRVGASKNIYDIIGQPNL